MSDDRQNSAPVRGANVREPYVQPEPPDPNKQPALSLYERHPEWKPRRRPWRRTLRQRRMESG
jgi:hypothetical protein